MQVSLRGHRIKYILMGFTGSVLSAASFDKIGALENTERNSFQLIFLSYQSIKIKLFFFLQSNFLNLHVNRGKPWLVFQSFWSDKKLRFIQNSFGVSHSFPRRNVNFQFIDLITLPDILRQSDPIKTDNLQWTLENNDLHKMNFK